MRTTKGIIYTLIAVLMVTSIMLVIAETSYRFVEYPGNVVLKEEAMNYCDVFNPDMNQPIYEINYDEEDIVREYNIKIDKDMDIMTQFIKSRNNRAPLIVADCISNSIISNCRTYDVPSELILGIVEVESFFDPSALGPPVGGNKRRRARGLGQILDKKCGKEKIIKDKLHNIDYNIVCTIKIIKSKLKSTGGDLDKSLYYYVGEDKVYAAKVFKTMGEFIYFRSQKT